MLWHCWQNFDHFFSKIGCSKIVKSIWMVRSEWLTHDHHACLVRVDHLSIFFACEESKPERSVNYLFFVWCISTVNDFNIVTEELITEFSASSKIEQIELLLRLFVEIIGGIGVSLHHFPLEKLSKAKLKHQGADSVAHFLGFSHQSVNFDAIDEFSTENLLVTHMINDFGSIIFRWSYNASIMVLSLICSFSLVVTFTMKFRSWHPNELLDI